MFLKKSLNFILLCCAPLLSSAVEIQKDIQYSTVDKGEYNKLDIYYPKVKGEAKDVIIFIHGGSWRSGNKKDYWWLGRNFARKNTVAVIINYPLSPKSAYEEMAIDCAEAVKWVQANISKYGGNPNRIFLMGHSAGAHLSALINQDKRFFAKAGIKNPVRGVILNDAFGLDMYQYITTDRKSEHIPGFMETFTTKEEIWKKASPMNYTSIVPSPYLIFMGEKTYPSIRLQSPIFYNKVKSAQSSSEIREIKGKKHVAMIAQMFFGCNKLYGLILDFMKKN